jgi:hypothetical protein
MPNYGHSWTFGVVGDAYSWELTNAVHGISSKLARNLSDFFFFSLSFSRTQLTRDQGLA